MTDCRTRALWTLVPVAMCQTTIQPFDMRSLLIAISALTYLSAAAAEESLWQGQTAAFFGVTLLDTSTEGALNGVRSDETARVALIEEYVRDALREQGLNLVDLGPVTKELERTANPADCNGCDLRMAQELEARYSIVAEVQKVSNLIIAMNLYVRDAETGAQLRGQAVDVRGNTDDTWLRGMRYILTRNVFAD